jgi:hypothetical protein
VRSESRSEKVSVHIRFKDVEQTFTGNVNDVWFLVNKFFSDMIPDFEIVNKVMLTVDLQKLVEDCRDVVAVTPEGIAVLVAKDLLTDNEAIMLHLLASYVGYKLGVLETDAITKEALQNGLGKSAKIVSTRLGELSRKGHIVKMDGNYKISTIGIRTLQSELLPKLRTKHKH